MAKEGIDHPRLITYGDDRSQFADLYRPPGATAPFPVVVLIHGGFWRAQYGLDLMHPLAEDLLARGYAVLNIEYRRVGIGGGYPETLLDVAAAIDALATESAELDLDNVVIIGHSAGGHLALWAAGRAELPAGAPGADPVVVPRLAIGLGPVFDLVAADAATLGSFAVTEFMGGTSGELPDEYAIATPSTSTGVRLAVVRGELDDIVPAQFAVPTPIGDVTVVDIADEDHFDLIDPASNSWAAVIELLTRT
ncbi:MAG: alpha/beta hydrolase [Actinomycetia bacterium]|nr:alpha/beta hydrolase [Actinomycetes bacterium]